MNQTLLSERLSYVYVIEEGDDAWFGVLKSIDEILEKFTAEHDLVLVANGVQDSFAKSIADQIDDLPDATVHFLPSSLEPSQATLIGIDNAIGDWVLLCAPEDVAPDCVETMLESGRAGYSQVILDSEIPDPKFSLYNLCERFFFALYRTLTMIDVTREGWRCRLLSREVGLYILASRHGDMLLKSRRLVSGFPSTTVKRPDGLQRVRSRSAHRPMIKALTAFIRSGPLLVRFISVLGIFGAMANLVYALYVLVVYLVSDDYVRGWTTQSLQLAGMFFVFSILFALIGEYLVQIEQSVNARLRYSVVREIRSRRSRSLNRMNLIVS